MWSREPGKLLPVVKGHPDRTLNTCRDAYGEMCKRVSATATEVPCCRRICRHYCVCFVTVPMKTYLLCGAGSWFVFFSLLDSTKRVPTIIPMHSAAELRVPCISSGEGSRARTRTPLNRLFFSARGRFPFPFQILLFLREKLATPPTPPPKKKPLCCPTKLCRIIQVPAKPGRSPTPWPACCLLW